MVKAFKNIIAFFQLIRIQNLLIIIITQSFLRWFVLIPSLGVNNFKSQISDIYFLGIVLATCFIAAAGYVINDYFDRKTDLINHPRKVVVGRLINRRAAMFWHFLLSIAGIFIGSFTAYKLGLFKFSIIFFLASGVLWFYSTTYKRQLLIGNILVSLLVAMVPFMVIIFEFPLLIKSYRLYLLAEPRSLNYLVAWFASYFVFAFMLTLIREIIKDVEDFEGDAAFGCQTIPIVWGIRVSKIILLGLIIITVLPIIYIIVKYLFDVITVIYVLTLIVFPLLIIMVLVWKAESTKSYSRISSLLKAVMLSGLLYSVVAYAIIKQIC